MIRISLVVPTYNRVQDLQESLKSFVNQSLDKDLYEILVVDNNSSDNTAFVVDSILSKYSGNWKYIFEKRQGLHYARNRGILEAGGDIIVFGDDDIIAHEKWLENILCEFCENQQTGIVGGKILPNWESVPPQWIYDYGSEKVHPIFALLDYGDERKTLKNEYVVGCNFSIRTDLAKRIGGSPPDTFPKKLKHLSGIGECLMADSVRDSGYDVVYLPTAYVYHKVASSRISLEYFIDRYQRFAVEKSFNDFNKYSKFKAATLLYKEALSMLINVNKLILKNRLFSQKKNTLGKINIDYFLKIEKAWASYLLQHVSRVLFDKKLYKHITQHNYMD